MYTSRSLSNTRFVIHYRTLKIRKNAWNTVNFQLIVSKIFMKKIIITRFSSIFIPLFFMAFHVWLTNPRIQRNPRSLGNFVFFFYSNSCSLMFCLWTKVPRIFENWQFWQIPNLIVTFLRYLLILYIQRFKM